MASVDASSCAVPQQAQQLTLPVILQLVFALLCIAGTAAAQRPAQPAPPQRFEKVLWCSDEAGHALARARGYTCLRLEIRADNAASLALFRGRGYREFGRHAAYYHDGMDALRLQKALAPRIC